MSHGTLPTMTVIRDGKALRINVADYDPDKDSMPGAPPPFDPLSEIDGGFVQIPDNWQSLPWQQLRQLASSISGKSITNRNDALAAIQEVIDNDAE